MELAGVLLIYGGLALLASAFALFLLRPKRRRGRELRRLLLRAGTGALLLIVGAALPPRETRLPSQATLHDRFAPVYQFNETHDIEIAAGRRAVYSAIIDTTAAEIPLFRTLTWLRRMGRPGPESILNSPERQPLLAVATRTGFLSLAEDSGREIVVGTIVLAPRPYTLKGKPTPEEYAALQTPGYAKATMNFFVEEISPGRCRVRTETRVHATDAVARRRFAAYWRIIYPGSSLIRHMWLRAIRARALKEAPAQATLE